MITEFTPDMDETETASPLIQPQPHARRWLAAGVVVTLTLTAGFLLWCQPALQAWLNDGAVSADARAVRTAKLLLVLLATMLVGCFALASWLGWLAWRIHRLQLFPPPGYPVLTVTRQVRGVAAQHQARLHAAGSAAALLLGLLVLAGLFFYLPLFEALRLLRP